MSGHKESVDTATLAEPVRAGLCPHLDRFLIHCDRPAGHLGNRRGNYMGEWEVDAAGRRTDETLSTYGSRQPVFSSRGELGRLLHVEGEDAYQRDASGRIVDDFGDPIFPDEVSR